MSAPVSSTTEKMKASNFPLSLLRIATWGGEKLCCSCNYCSICLSISFSCLMPFGKVSYSIMQRQISVTASRHLIDVIDCSWLSHVF